MAVMQMQRFSSMQGLHEKQLETVVSRNPRSPLMVVRGKHAGRHARLVSKQQDSALVEFTESGDIAEVSLDDIADYDGVLEGEDL
jgi:ribosomal protein S4E